MVRRSRQKVVSHPWPDREGEGEGGDGSGDYGDQEEEGNESIDEEDEGGGSNPQSSPARVRKPRRRGAFIIYI